MFIRLQSILAAGLLAASLIGAPQVAQAQASAAESAAVPAASVAPAVAVAAAPAPSTDAVTTKETVDNPYGLSALWAQGDFVSRFVLILLALMSMGSWYIMITKLYESI